MKKILGTIISCILIISLLCNSAYCCDCDDTHECSGGGVGGTIDASLNAINGTHTQTKMHTYWELGTEGSVATDVPKAVSGDISGTNVKAFKYFNKTFGYNGESKGGTIMTQNVDPTGEITYYPYVKMNWASLGQQTYTDCYMFAETLSHINEQTIVNVAVEQPSKPTIEVNSRWNGWTKAMTALNKLGITDKNSLVNGGNLIELYTHGEKDVAGSKNASGNSANTFSNSADSVGTNVCIEAYMVQVPSSMTGAMVSFCNSEMEVNEAFDEFEAEMDDNLNNLFLEKVITKGVQLTENDFESKLPVAVGGTNGQGNFDGLTLDTTHSKYYLNKLTGYSDGSETGRTGIDKNNDGRIDAHLMDTIKVTYTISSDSKGMVYFDGGESGGGQKEGKSLKSGDSVNKSAVDTFLKSIGKKDNGSDWFHMNEITGFVDDYINTTDFNKGKGGKHNGVGADAGWYNEALSGISIQKRVYWYKLTLDDVRWEVHDPALCGYNKTSNKNFKSDLYNSDSVNDYWRTFRYQLASSGTSGVGQSIYIGTLGDCEVYLDNMEEVMRSKLMYCCNSSVYDLQQ